jgi:endonuclease/exonuclease/phosphatase (EEP) superfamily protein YafD
MTSAESNKITGFPRQPWRNQARIAIRWVVPALLAVTLAPHLRGLLPALALFEHFAAQLAVVSAIAGGTALFLRQRRWALLAGMIALANGLAVMPYLGSTSLTGATAAPANAPLKLLSLNIWFKNHNHAPTVDYLLHSGADVIGLVEATPEWLDALKPLEAVYPYRLNCVGQMPQCGVAIFSKHPFSHGFAGHIGPWRPALVTVTLDLDGTPFTLTELQLTNPLTDLGDGRQTRQADLLADYLAAQAGNQVVMGDFNSAPWSGLQRQLRARTGIDNSGRLAFTWPSWAPAIFRIPIDQIFVRGSLTVSNYRAGPAVGSDHLPLLAEIALKP